MPSVANYPVNRLAHDAAGHQSSGVVEDDLSPRRRLDHVRLELLRDAYPRVVLVGLDGDPVHEALLFPVQAGGQDPEGGGGRYASRRGPAEGHLGEGMSRLGLLDTRLSARSGKCVHEPLSKRNSCLARAITVDRGGSTGPAMTQNPPVCRG